MITVKSITKAIKLARKGIYTNESVIAALLNKGNVKPLKEQIMEGIQTGLVIATATVFIPLFYIGLTLQAILLLTN